MDVGKSRVLRAAAVLLAFAIVLAVAAETRAQFTRVDNTTIKGLIEYALREYTALGGFTPDSGQTMTGACAVSTPVEVFVTNGVASSLRYVENTSTVAAGSGCTFRLECRSGGCSGTLWPQASPYLCPKDLPAPPLNPRLFGFACSGDADTICLVPNNNSGLGFRLQADPGPR
jgi:hypothetical protein